MPRQDIPNHSSPSRVRIIGTLTKKLPLYRERGMTRATIIIKQYTIHLSGRDAAATQLLAIGARVEIVGTVRRAGQRSIMREIDGELVDDLEGVTIIDIGGGDLQRIECRLGDGTIRIARALREKFPMLELNDVAAQRALVTRRLMIAGRTRDISAQVQEAIASQGQAILADLLPSLRQSHRFVIITGGGVILLHDLIAERLALESKQLGDAYALVDHGLASLLNVIAVLFAVLFVTRK